MWSFPSLPLFLSLLWPGGVVPVRVPFIGQIELLNFFVGEIGIIIISYFKLYICVKGIPIR